MLTKVKLAMRVNADAYDTEINSLINSAKRDLILAGVQLPMNAENDDLIVTAVTTYVRMHFGSPSDYDNLKRSYDEQKAQLQIAEDYRSDNNV